MKNSITILLIAVAAIANAQNAGQTINNASNTINNAAGTINNAGNTIHTISQIGSKFGSFFAKKNKDADPAPAAAKPAAAQQQQAPVQPVASTPVANTTIITLNNTDYDKTSTVVAFIKSVGTVSNVSKKLSGNTAIITVTHTDTTESLIDALNAKGMFTVNALDAGVATLTLR